MISFNTPSVLSRPLRALIWLLLLTAVCGGGLNRAAAQSLPGSGNALTMNGYSSYINCGNSNRGITQQVTVEAWIKTTSSNYEWVIGKYTNSLLEEKGFHLYIYGGNAGISGRIGVGQYMSSGLSTTRINDGQWHHLAGVCDFSTWRIYVDGVLEKAAAYTASRSDLTTSTLLTIGNYYEQRDQYFSGELDEVRVWRTARSTADIQRNMCRKFVTAPADLVAYYRFDQTSGSQVVDGGSVAVAGSLVGLAANWHLSGAPLGDASSSLYQTAWPSGTRVGTATATGDSAIVSSVQASVLGVQVYAVNSPPTIAPPGSSQTTYLGVFTAAGGAASSGYAVRLRPAAGLQCHNAYLRPGNDSPWNLLAQLPSTATSVVAAGQQFRGEYLLAPGLPVVAAITGDSVLCPGATTQLTAVVGSGVSVRWSTGATTALLSNVAPGTYTLTVVAGSGCTRVLRRTVRAVVPPTLAITGDSLLCGGGSTILTANAAGAAGATTYRWSTGATTPSIPITQTGSYSVTVTYGTGCTTTARRNVRISPPLALTIGGDSLLCPGSSTVLTATTTGAGTLTYRWSTGATTASITVTQAGPYSVVATYGGGCQAGAQRMVRPNNIAPPLPFSLGADTTLCEGTQVVLRGPAGPNFRYLWSTGSTTRQLAVNTAGRYTLRVLSACGEQSASRGVALTPCLRIPNIVTANADGHNDQFAISGLVGEGWMLDVYNRWGGTVYQTASYRNDWGGDAAPGMYYVLLRRPATGYVYKGWVEVMH